MSLHDIKVFRSSLELLEGSWPTPLVRLSKISKGGMEFWAKLEYYNPFSRSVKDRAAWGWNIKWNIRNI